MARATPISPRKRVVVEWDDQTTSNMCCSDKKLRDAWTYRRFQLILYTEQNSSDSSNSVQFYRARKMRKNNLQKTTEDIQSPRYYLLKLSQDSFFHSTIHSLKSGIKLDSKCKIRCLNPFLDEKGLFRSCGRLQHAPTQLDLEKRPILHAKDKNWSFVLGTCPSGMYLSVHITNKSFQKTTLPCDWPSQSVSKHTISLFLCRRFDTTNIQPIMAPQPCFRFPIAETQFPFANCGVDFFGPFYVEDSKGVVEKHYALIFTCRVTRAVHLETCP